MSLEEQIVGTVLSSDFNGWNKSLCVPEHGLSVQEQKADEKKKRFFF